MKIISDNRKARFNYNLLDSFESGIVLTGEEIKSVRAGNINLGDAYCYIDNGEMWIKNLHITSQDPIRTRKLLLNKQEIRKIESKVKSKGVTAIPKQVYLNDKGLCKISIAIATGKKDFDKRNSIKERDLNRQMKNERY